MHLMQGTPCFDLAFGFSEGVGGSDHLLADDITLIYTWFMREGTGGGRIACDDNLYRRCNGISLL